MILRNLGEQILRAARLYEQQLVTTPAIRLFDTTSLPVEPSISYGRRKPVSVTLVVTHVTDVTGGFGVANTAVARWVRLLETGKVPTELLEQFDRNMVGPSERPRLLALFERYSRKGYHVITTAGADVVCNHPAWLRTVHANTANARAMGWAIDCGHTESLSDQKVNAGQAGLRQCIREAYEVNGGKVVKVAPHRCFSAQRRVDTSKEVHQRIVLPVVQELSSICRIDYELAENGGLPVCRDWDPNALFDAKGRHLRVVR